MEKHSTEFIGLDVHKESTAIGRASAGRTAGRFVGTVGPTLAELLKSLKSLADRKNCPSCTKQGHAATADSKGPYQRT